MSELCGDYSARGPEGLQVRRPVLGPDDKRRSVGQRRACGIEAQSETGRVAGQVAAVATDKPAMFRSGSGSRCDVGRRRVLFDDAGRAARRCLCGLCRQAATGRGYAVRVSGRGRGSEGHGAIRRPQRSHGSLIATSIVRRLRAVGVGYPRAGSSAAVDPRVATLELVTIVGGRLGLWVA